MSRVSKIRRRVFPKTRSEGLPSVKPQSAYDLMDWLDAVIVIPPGAWDNDDGPNACRFRLDYINRKMNP